MRQVRSDKVVFAIVNCAYYNRKPQGDVTVYASRKERDAAIKALRTRARGAGLSQSACESGIYEAQFTVGHARAKGYSLDCFNY